MDLDELAGRLWRTKWRTLLFAVLAVVIGILFTYRVSSSGITPRALRFGVAQTSLLVDSQQSPLATADVAPAKTNQLASDMALVVSSNFVTDAVARAIHVRPQAIGIAQQVTQNLPRTVQQAHEAQVANQLLADEQHYQVLVRNVQGTFVIQIFTQAPDGATAIKMADVVSKTMSAHIAQLGRDGHIPLRNRVVLRRLGDATGGLVDANATRDALVLIAIVAFVLLMIVGFTFDRLRRDHSPARATVAGPPHVGSQPS